jgi:SAM-dependent methyltransferase
MTQFANPHLSHDHSLEILNLLYGYDSFLDSLTVIGDMGCGSGLDAAWWATLETRDDPPEPRNYRVYAVDRTLNKIDDEIRATENIRWIEGNFEEYGILPELLDLVWAHDSFQFVTSPLNTLSVWNRQMNNNGMLVMALPQTINYAYNRLTFRTHSYSYYNYNISNLVYMLAVNGFDCSDAYFYKNVETDWIYLAVYKAEGPMDPSTTSWFDLADKNLLHPSVVDSLNRYGHVRQEDIVYPWLDKDFYRAKT